MKITAEQLRRIFSYDPETGRFTRISRTAACTALGTQPGSIMAQGYRRMQIKRVHYLAHRLVWLYMTGAWPERDIDHINGDCDDNRWANLRLATHAENMQNLSIANPTGKSGLYGAHACGKYFTANINVNGEVIYLGNFSTAQAAHEAYVAAKRKLHPTWQRDCAVPSRLGAKH